MTAEELLVMCEATLACGIDHITLVIPKGHPSRIEGFPRGTLLQENPNGSRVFSYNATRVRKAVLRALEAGA